MADTKLSGLPERVIAEGDYVEFLDQSESPADNARDSVRGILDLVPYDIPVVFGTTPSDGEVIGRYTMVRTIELPANFSGSQGTVETAPGATFNVDVRKKDTTVSPTVDTSIGTVSISTGGVYTFTTAGGSAQQMTAGQNLVFIAPSGSPSETSIAGISFMIKATAST